MKLRKILSSVVAGALALSAMTFSASAEAVTVLDFENGDFTGVTMKTDDGGDKSELSVVDYNGSKQLRVAIQKPDRVPKVFFDINTLVGADNMSKVAGFKADVTIQSTFILDESDPENILYEVPSWQGGGCGAQDGTGGSLGWTELGAWTIEEYEAASKTATLEWSLGGKTFTDGTEGSHILLMKWASASNPVDMYLDNITFLDADGNAMELYPVADAATEEEATEDETTEETPVEDEATEETEDDAEAEEETEDEVVEEDEAPVEEEVEEDATVEEETEDEVVEDEAPATGDVDASTDSSKGSPDTGVEDVAVVVGLAIVAAGAVLVSKKRK